MRKLARTPEEPRLATIGRDRVEVALLLVPGVEPIEHNELAACQRRCRRCRRRRRRRRQAGGTGGRSTVVPGTTPASRDDRGRRYRERNPDDEAEPDPQRHRVAGLVRESRHPPLRSPGWPADEPGGAPSTRSSPPRIDPRGNVAHTVRAVWISARWASP